MILRNAYCPRTVLRINAQYLSAGGLGPTLPIGGHGRV